MFDITKYIKRFSILFESYGGTAWQLPETIEKIIREKMSSLPSDYRINGEQAIHNTAKIEEGVIMKGPMIIGPSCFIGAHAYLRGGIFLDEKVVVGPGCEVKSSVLFRQSALAHFNFVGDSIVGESVNMEAGSILANHYNERSDKTIYTMIGSEKTKLPVVKFGAIVGDRSRIGANAVLSPGSLLSPDSVVKRLQLIEQVPEVRQG